MILLQFKFKKEKELLLSEFVAGIFETN